MSKEEMQMWKDRWEKDPQGIQMAQRMVEIGRLTPQEYREITREKVPKEIMDVIEDKAKEMGRGRKTTAQAEKEKE